MVVWQQHYSFRAEIVKGGVIGYPEAVRHDGQWKGDPESELVGVGSLEFSYASGIGRHL